MIDLLVPNSSKTFVFISWIPVRELPTSVKITAVIRYSEMQPKVSQYSLLVESLPLPSKHVLCPPSMSLPSKHVPCPPSTFSARATIPPSSYSCLLPRIAGLRTRAFLMELECICGTIGHFWLTCFLFSSWDKKGHAYTICLHW